MQIKTEIPVIGGTVDENKDAIDSLARYHSNFITPALNSIAHAIKNIEMQLANIDKERKSIDVYIHPGVIPKALSGDATKENKKEMKNEGSGSPTKEG